MNAIIVSINTVILIWFIGTVNLSPTNQLFMFSFIIKFLVRLTTTQNPSRLLTEGVGIHYLTVDQILQGLISQISLAYSLIVLSDENLPELQMLIQHILAHFISSL